MEKNAELKAYESGYEAALEDALHVVDSLRRPGGNNLATPIILRIRAELIALREGRDFPQAA